jgi:ComF family protein
MSQAPVNAAGLAGAWARRSGKAMARWLAGTARALESFALPQRCPECGSAADPDRLLCDRCREAIPPLRLELCARCLAHGSEPVGCRRHPGRGVWAAWVYDERAALLVHALKYGGRPRLAQALGPVIAAALPAGARFDLVFEVPLHPARLRERGYNQAAALADAVAGALAVPRWSGALIRVRPTREQARLGPAARRANVAGAFRAIEPAALGGRRVLVVDDVLTTGNTLEACLDAVRDAGAEAAGAVLAWAQ